MAARLVTTICIYLTDFQFYYLTLYFIRLKIDKLLDMLASVPYQHVYANFMFMSLIFLVFEHFERFDQIVLSQLSLFLALLVNRQTYLPKVLCCSDSSRFQAPRFHALVVSVASVACLSSVT